MPDLKNRSMNLQDFLPLFLKDPMQTKLKKLQQEDKEDNPQNVTNALFVGSTADLQKLIKGNDE